MNYDIPPEGVSPREAALRFAAEDRARHERLCADGGAGLPDPPTPGFWAGPPRWPLNTPQRLADWQWQIDFRRRIEQELILALRDGRLHLCGRQYEGGPRIAIAAGALYRSSDPMARPEDYVLDVDRAILLRGGRERYWDLVVVPGNGASAEFAGAPPAPVMSGKGRRGQLPGTIDRVVMMRPDAWIYMSRSGWYARIIEWFDLVPLRDIADELAHAHGDLMPNEARRAEAHRRLVDAILKGEFGAPAKPAVVWLPEDITAVRPARLNLRPRGRDIVVWRAHNHPALAELWLPRRLVARWLAARRIEPPPWLAEADSSREWPQAPRFGPQSKALSVPPSMESTAKPDKARTKPCGNAGRKPGSESIDDDAALGGMPALLASGEAPSVLPKPDWEMRAVKRRDWIKRFAERQRSLLRWIPFSELADWCAHSTTAAGRAEEDQAQDLAWQRLVESVARGEFERDGKSKVLYLDPHASEDGWSPRCRLTREQFEIAFEAAAMPPAPSLPFTVLGRCWLSRELARRWIERHGYRWPAHFEPESLSAVSLPNENRQKKPLSPPLTRRPSREKPFWAEARKAAFQWLEEEGCPAPNDGRAVWTPLMLRLHDVFYKKYEEALTPEARKEVLYQRADELTVF